MALPGRELLDDLCTRFILNSPPEELASFERLLFLIEQAHWFYEDFAREADPDARLASLSLKRFATLIFNTCPGLQPYSSVLNAIYKQFSDYKQSVPVMGAIMLNAAMDKCLLVKSWGSNGAWGFPRGKISTGEADIDCARREVLEETGYDLGDALREEDSIEVHIGQKRTRLYIVAGVPEDTHFAPQVRKEISALAWHAVAHLPASRDQDSQVFTNDAGSRHKFFMVWNYVRQLRRWIKARQRAAASAQAASGKAQRAGKRVRGIAAARSQSTAAAAVLPPPPPPLPTAASAGPPAASAAAVAAAAAAQAALRGVSGAGAAHPAAQQQPHMAHPGAPPRRPPQQALQLQPAAELAAAEMLAAAAAPTAAGGDSEDGSGEPLGVLLSRAAAAAHASPATGLQGPPATAASHGETPAAGHAAAGPAHDQQQPSLRQLSADPAAALAPSLDGPPSGDFSSNALSGFRFDTAAILRHLVF